MSFKGQRNIPTKGEEVSQLKIQSGGFTLMTAFLSFCNAILLAFMIWMAVLISQTVGSICVGADFSSVGDYVVAQNVVAEPYSGVPSSITANVTSSAICQTTCSAASDCLFFTHDRTNGNCYFYNTSTLPLQNKNAAVVGPSPSVKGNVYVKNTGRLVQMRNVL